MPFQSTVLRVVIVSPSDVGPIRDSIEQCIHQWTSEHSFRQRVTLLPVRWETDASPDVGRPQEVINHQIIDPADILVAVFRSKVGSPTGKEDSGTIEEIKRGIDQGKRVMIYFSRSEADDTSPELEQTEKLRQFKQWCRERALYFEYDSKEQLLAQVRRHLSASVDSIMKRSDSGSETASSAGTAAVATGQRQAPLSNRDGEGAESPEPSPGQRSLEPLDTGLVRRDAQLRACLDLSGMMVTKLTDEEIHFRFTLTNIGRHHANISIVQVMNADMQIYRVYSPHRERLLSKSDRIHELRVPRAFPNRGNEPERWRFDVLVEFLDGIGKEHAEYVFYMEGTDPDFTFREDKDAAILSSTCRQLRG